MSWYVIHTAGHTLPDGTPAPRPVLCWDERSKLELWETLKHRGAIEVERVQDRRRGGKMQSKGTILILHPHLVSIESRLDMDYSDPNGPEPFQHDQAQ